MYRHCVFSISSARAIFHGLIIDKESTIINNCIVKLQEFYECTYCSGSRSFARVKAST